ncbi:response regulator [Pedobacter sp.]
MKQKRILIIEDDPDILDILDIIFVEDGYEVITNATGMLADEIAVINPDLILLDVRISGFQMTGAQLCWELKSLPQTKDMPVVLLSAERDLHRLAEEAHADAMVNKPFDIEQLLLTAKQLVKN